MSKIDAKKNVSEIVNDLKDRRGLKQEWYQIDGEIQKEIIKEWEFIIKNNLKKYESISKSKIK